MYETIPSGYLGDIAAPELIGSRNGQLSQQIGIVTAPLTPRLNNLINEHVFLLLYAAGFVGRRFLFTAYPRLLLGIMLLDTLLLLLASEMTMILFSIKNLF